MEINHPIKNPPGVSHGGKVEEGNHGANVSDQKMDCKGDVVLNYYQFHIGDFRSGTVNMSRHARWIYRDMLDVYYDKEGPLPLDLDELCDAIGVESDEERCIVERHLRFKFEKREDGYHNEACNRVISEYHGKADTARTNGKLGGRPKKPKQTQSVIAGLQSGSDMVSKTKPKQTQSQANQEPITNNQEPILSNESKARKRASTPEKPIDVPDNTWQDFLAIRKAKRSPLTQTALDGIQREAEKAGLHLVDAIAYCCEAGWQGFKADWYTGREGGGSLGLTGGRALNKQEALEARNGEVAKAWVADMKAKMAKEGNHENS